MPTNPQPITALPTPPSTSDPVNFDPRADAFLGALPGMTVEQNNANSVTYNNAVEAAASATAANTSASQAASSAASAGNSATAANTSASQSASSLSDMQKYYLGAKTAFPTTDNQGNSLVIGCWFTYIGTDPAYAGIWLWWDGVVWQPGIGNISNTYMPKTGGIFTGPISVPSGATGNQVPRIVDVVTKVVPSLEAGENLNNLTTFGPFIAKTGVLNSPIADGYWYILNIPDGSNWAQQIASSEDRTHGMWVRYKKSNVWGSWSRIITDDTFIEKQKNTASVTGSYVANPAEGSIHYITMTGATQIQLPATGRQFGDQITVRAQMSGSGWPITFNSVVSPPVSGSMPTYTNNQIITLVFTYNRTGKWDLFYSGVHAV